MSFQLSSKSHSFKPCGHFNGNHFAAFLLLGDFHLEIIYSFLNCNYVSFNVPSKPKYPHSLLSTVVKVKVEAVLTGGISYTTQRWKYLKLVLKIALIDFNDGTYSALTMFSSMKAQARRYYQNPFLRGITR